MRIIYNGYFQQLKQAGIDDKRNYRYYFELTEVECVQSLFLMIISILANTFPGYLSIDKVLKMGFPNKRISCKRKRRIQF